MQNARLDEAQARIKIVRRNTNNHRYADNTTLMAESEEELKNLLMKVKEESVKIGFKTQHSKNEDRGKDGGGIGREDHFLPHKFSSFTFIKRLFSSSLSAIRVVSSAYLRLLIFLLAILIPICDSSSPAFPMVCTAYKLNKHGDNIQP